MMLHVNLLQAENYTFKHALFVLKIYAKKYGKKRKKNHPLSCSHVRE